MKRTIISAAMLASMVALPLFAQASITGLQVTPPAPTPVAPSPLACFDFANTLKMGSKGNDVRGLQFALMQEGLSISPSEYGTFGSDTLAAVNAFQQKYASDVLTGLPGPTGLVGPMTRAKLNSIYGCAAMSQKPMVIVGPSVPASVILKVTDVTIDSTGVTVVACNASPTAIPVFPLRVRLNGIIRDFSVLGAVNAGACDTNDIPYSAWGLTYDPSVTYGVVTSIDPNGMYKTSQVGYALSATTTLAVPAVQGAQLAVRGLSLKSGGVQATLCNLGTSDLSSYPVRVTVNGVSENVDASGVHTHGVCQAVTWTYDQFSLPATPPVGTIITATVNIDPNNIIQETNEFDNSATVYGTL